MVHQLAQVRHRVGFTGCGDSPQDKWAGSCAEDRLMQFVCRLARFFAKSIHLGAGAGGLTAIRLPVVSSPTSLLKRLVVGRPFRSDRLGHTLLPKRIALPIFASDPLSSVAYATQEILLILTLGGLAYLYLTPWIGAAVVLLLAVVVLSYRQVVQAYPSGGGSSEVGAPNLRPRAGQAGAAAQPRHNRIGVAVSVGRGGGH